MREKMIGIMAEAWPAAGLSNPSQGGCGGLVQSRSRHLAESSLYRINDPWLSCRLEANALIEQELEPASDIRPVKRPYDH